MLPVLAAQHFSGGALVRGLGAGRTVSDILRDASPASPLLLLVRDRQVAAAGPTSLAWRSLEQLRAGAGWQPAPGGGGDEAALEAPGGGPPLPVYILGQESGGCVKLAVDVSALDPAAAEVAQGLQLQELRALMPSLPAPELAAAGHAVALCQWHQARAGWGVLARNSAACACRLLHSPSADG